MTGWRSSVTAKNTPQKFFKKAVPDVFGCWLWTGGCNACGYGIVRYRGLQRLAHRAAWEICYGPIPDGMGVLHRCDCPPCINPAHLFLGTQADNVADMERKKRSNHPHSQNHGRAKFTAEEVKEIRASPLSSGKLAKKFWVSKTAIRYIRQKDTWRGVV
jgi:hypothetical protein